MGFTLKVEGPSTIELGTTSVVGVNSGQIIHMIVMPVLQIWGALLKSQGKS